MHKTPVPEALEQDPLKAGPVIPDDFPNTPSTAALPGTQTKFSARLIDGKYVVGLTTEERHRNYLYCLDLLEQLIAYVHRKLHENPTKPVSEVMDNVVSRIPLQGWDLVNPEIEWISRRLRDQFEDGTPQGKSKLEV